MSGTVTLKLTGAIALSGVIVKAGTTVEVDNATAQNLLHRGKAELAESPNAPAEGAGKSDEPEMVLISEGVEVPMSEVITQAQKDAGLTAKKFKALPAAEAEKLVESTIAAMRKAAVPAA